MLAWFFFSVIWEWRQFTLSHHQQLHPALIKQQAQGGMVLLPIHMEVWAMQVIDAAGKQAQTPRIVI